MQMSSNKPFENFLEKERRMNELEKKNKTKKKER